MQKYSLKFILSMTLFTLIYLIPNAVQARNLLHVPLSKLAAQVAKLPLEKRLPFIEQALKNAPLTKDLAKHITLLLMKGNYYYKKQNNKLIQVILDDVFVLLKDKQLPLLLANTHYLHAMNKSMLQRQYDEATAIFKTAISTLQQNSFLNEQQLPAQKLLLASTYKLASLLLLLQQPDNAKSYLMEAKILAATLNDSEYQINAAMKLSQYYVATDQLVKAEQELMATYQLALAQKSNRLSIVLVQFSRFYRKNQQFELAIEYALKAVDLARESYIGITVDSPLPARIRQADVASSVYNNLAICYEESGDLNLAMVHYLNIINSLKINTRNIYYSLAHHNLGQLYKKQQNLAKALYYFKISGEHFKEIGHQFYLLSNNLSLADVYMQQKNYQQAIVIAEKALIIAKERKALALQKTAHQYLSESYLQTQQYQQASIHYAALLIITVRQQARLEEKIVALKNKPQPQSINLQQQIAQLNDELAQSQKDNEKAITVLSLLKLVIVLLGITFLIFALRLKLTKKPENMVNHVQRSLTRYNISFIANTAHFHQIFQENYASRQYLMTLEVMKIDALFKYMNYEQASQLIEQWFIELSNVIKQDIYLLNSSTIIFAASIQDSAQQNTQQDTSHNIGQFLSSVLQNINEAMPIQLQELNDESLFITTIGCTTIDKGHAENRLIDITNYLNLSLTALNGVQTISHQQSKKNWLCISPKTPNIDIMSPDRSRWLYAIENNLMTMHCGHDLTNEHTIDWQTTFYQIQ